MGIVPRASELTGLPKRNHIVGIKFGKCSNGSFHGKRVTRAKVGN